MPRASTKNKAASSRRSRATKAHLTTSLEKFSRLPPEIRQHIWRLALPSQISPGVCLLGARFTPSKQVERIVHDPYSQLRRVCRESRGITFPLTRQFNPDMDILYLSVANFRNFCLVCRDKHWPAQVQHIAIELPLADSRVWSGLPNDNSGPRLPLEYLNKLKKISIVYPKAIGDVNYRGRVVLPKQRVQILRELSNKEMTSLKIHAEYWPDRDYAEIWTMTARQHLSYIKGMLVRQAKDEQPPCWDKVAKRLILTFEARLFVQDST